MTSDKRCGTCLWADFKYTPVGVLNCMAPMPDSANIPIKLWMGAEQGTECPCYQPAQQPQKETN